MSEQQQTQAEQDYEPTILTMEEQAAVEQWYAGMLEQHPIPSGIPLRQQLAAYVAGLVGSVQVVQAVGGGDHAAMNMANEVIENLAFILEFTRRDFEGLTGLDVNNPTHDGQGSITLGRDEQGQWHLNEYAGEERVGTFPMGEADLQSFRNAFAEAGLL